MTEILSSRQNHLVDPQLHVWGWEIPVYLFLGGLAAGLMILTSLLAARPGPRSRVVRAAAFGGPLLLALGMGALFLDLEHRLHVWRFYLAFRPTSPMSWGAWILLAVFPVSLLFALTGLDDDEGRRAAGFARRFGLGGVLERLRAFALPRARGLARANLVLGLGLGLYTGVLLGTLGARALWSSGLLPPLFLVSGLSAGAAFLLLFRLTSEERSFVTRWDLVAIGLELVVLGLYLVDLGTSGAVGKSAAGLLLGGAYTAPFWSLVVIAGLVVPFLLEAFEARLHLPPTLIAPALVLGGGFALRWIFVAAGQA